MKTDIRPNSVGGDDGVNGGPLPGSGLLDLILHRRSIRQFLPREIPLHEVEEIVKIALWAPSPHNSQPWRVTYLRPETKSSLARAMGEQLRLDLENARVATEDIDAQIRKSCARIDSAPNAFLCSVVTDGLHMSGSSVMDALETQMAVQSVGAFLQTLFLAASDRGIGSCWLAAPMYCAETVRSALDLPDSFRPQALILLGYMAADGRVRLRRPLAEVLETR